MPKSSKRSRPAKTSPKRVAAVAGAVYAALEALVSNGFSDEELATRMSVTIGHVQRARRAIKAFDKAHPTEASNLRFMTLEQWEALLIPGASFD